MFNVGDKVVKKDGTEWNEPYKVVRIADEYGFIMLEGLNVIYCEEELKLYQEGNNMEKTFREVIVDIKEGEVWESNNYTIALNYLGDIIVKRKDDVESNIFLVRVDNTYKLQRKEYSFEDAFKKYNETPDWNNYGIVIESVVSGCKYVRRVSLAGEIMDCYLNSKNNQWIDLEENEHGFSVGEIRGKWYINN